MRVIGYDAFQRLRSPEGPLPTYSSSSPTGSFHSPKEAIAQAPELRSFQNAGLHLRVIPYMWQENASEGRV